uniref:Sine oculis-binding protein homolog n=2 Tax=Cacopsylla melanoneura TaxID=428564 RepID=A0A8D8X1M5_9HEMI
MSNIRQKKMDRHHRYDRQNIRIPILKIKKEPTETEPNVINRPGPEITDSAMSEILGWYGSIRRERGNFTVSPAYPTSPSGSHKSYSAESEDDSCSTTNTKPPAKFDVCGWCAKSITSESMFSIDEKSFCSEVCFTQCRRASFKKNKTCDWCRHIRHTVNYVDFQQLQFCSNKCLNQYKMNIFCKETQEHLDLHPHPEAESSTPSFSNAEDSSLITPELWMNNHGDSPPPEPEHNASSRPSSSDTPSPPPLPYFPPKPSILNGTLSGNSKMKTLRTKKKSKLLDKQNFQMKFKKIIPHYTKSHLTQHNPPLPFYRSPFPTPSMMFDHPAFRNSTIRNPPPLLRILRPTAPPQPSPVTSQSPPIVPQTLPPPTTLVPYPFIIPLPIPIPIVLPLPINPEEFYRILKGTKQEAKPEVIEQESNTFDHNDCQTNKPMKKRKKVTSIVYGSSSNEKTQPLETASTILIETHDKDDEPSPGNHSINKKRSKVNSDVNPTG